MLKFTARTVGLVPNRGVVAVRGADSIKFLQGLVTKDLSQWPNSSQAKYAHFLLASGRVLFDVLIHQHADQSILLDCDHNSRTHLISHLKRYALRSKVEFDDCASLKIVYHTQASIPRTLTTTQDPRNSAMGFRSICEDYDDVDNPIAEPKHCEYTRLRYLLGIPEGSADFFTGGFLLPHESNLDIMNGVDYNKGCYVGQELVTRTHHRGVVRKRVCPIWLHQADKEADGFKSEFSFESVIPESPLQMPLDIMSQSSTKPVGKLLSVYGNCGLALMRLDYLGKTVSIPGTGLCGLPHRPHWWSNAI